MTLLIWVFIVLFSLYMLGAIALTLYGLALTGDWRFRDIGLIFLTGLIWPSFVWKVLTMPSGKKMKFEKLK